MAVGSTDSDAARRRIRERAVAARAAVENARLTLEHADIDLAFVQRACPHVQMVSQGRDHAGGSNGTECFDCGLRRG